MTMMRKVATKASREKMNKKKITMEMTKKIKKTTRTRRKKMKKKPAATKRKKRNQKRERQADLKGLKRGSLNYSKRPSHSRTWWDSAVRATRSPRAGVISSELLRVTRARAKNWTS